jgi:hypothetical protein
MTDICNIALDLKVAVFSGIHSTDSVPDLGDNDPRNVHNYRGGKSFNLFLFSLSLTHFIFQYQIQWTPPQRHLVITQLKLDLQFQVHVLVQMSLRVWCLCRPPSPFIIQFSLILLRKILSQSWTPIKLPRAGSHLRQIPAHCPHHLLCLAWWYYAGPLHQREEMASSTAITCTRIRTRTRTSSTARTRVRTNSLRPGLRKSRMTHLLKENGM